MEILVIALSLMLLVIFTIYGLMLVKNLTKKLIINFISGILFAFIVWYFKIVKIPIVILIIGAVLGIPGVVLSILLFNFIR
jgi:hypothetical protein